MHTQVLNLQHILLLADYQSTLKYLMKWKALTILYIFSDVFG